MDYPLATLAPTITAAGISAPSYSDLLTSLQVSFRSIYGPDAYIEADSQDGQLVALVARAIHESNQAAISVFNSFNPQFAQGVGLSNVVKINHIARLVPTKSNVDVRLTGVAGTVITNGIVADALGNKWVLPAYVAIASTGLITVTATSEQDGAIPAAIGDINRILTPTAGWQTVSNLVSAALGQPVESDASLRARQEVSPAMNSVSVLDGITANIRELSGVNYVRPYENDTNTTNLDGLPAHSISMVVQGGDNVEIGTTILNRKGPGVGTFGTTSVNIVDVSGALRVIQFSRPVLVPIHVLVTLQVGDSYTSVIGVAIRQAIADYINALLIGEDVIAMRLAVPAMLNGAADSLTYKLMSVETSLTSGSFASADLVIAYNGKATCDIANVMVTVI